MDIDARLISPSTIEITTSNQILNAGVPVNFKFNGYSSKTVMVGFGLKEVTCTFSGTPPYYIEDTVRMTVEGTTSPIQVSSTNKLIQINKISEYEYDIVSLATFDTKNCFGTIKVSGSDILPKDNVINFLPLHDVSVEVIPVIEEDKSVDTVYLYIHEPVNNMQISCDLDQVHIKKVENTGNKEVYELSIDDSILRPIVATVTVFGEGIKKVIKKILFLDKGFNMATIPEYVMFKGVLMTKEEYENARVYDNEVFNNEIVSKTVSTLTVSPLSLVMNIGESDFISVHTNAKVFTVESKDELTAIVEKVSQTVVKVTALKAGNVNLEFKADLDGSESNAAEVSQLVQVKVNAAPATKEEQPAAPILMNSRESLKLKSAGSVTLEFSELNGNTLEVQAPNGKGSLGGVSGNTVEYTAPTVSKREIITLVARAKTTSGVMSEDVEIQITVDKK